MEMNHHMHFYAEIYDIFLDFIIHKEYIFASQAASFPRSAWERGGVA
jgi:hypothetical protein